MKYIDANRLKELLDAKYKEFIEKAKKDCPLQYQYMADGLDIAEQFVDSLQQEQPDEDLERAAEEYYQDASRHLLDNSPIGTAKDAFKAGAEWMAGRGETQEHFVIGSIAGSPCGPAVVCYTEEFAIGDQVIVQIRKKEENHD